MPEGTRQNQYYTYGGALTSDILTNNTFTFTTTTIIYKCSVCEDDVEYKDYSHATSSCRSCEKGILNYIKALYKKNVLSSKELKE